MASPWSLFLAVAILASLLPAASPASLTRKGCTFRGRSYADGQRFKPETCMRCHCDNGLPLCIDEDCEDPTCVNPVNVPGQCCAVCPRGNDCRTSEGIRIPVGQEELVLKPTMMICACEPDDTNPYQNVANCRVA